MIRHSGGPSQYAQTIRVNRPPASPSLFQLPSYSILVTKRVFDVALTLLIAPLAAAVTLLFAAVLAVELRGNPFYVQERIGLRGRSFRMWKLRTMYHARPGEEDVYVVDDFKTFVFHPPGKEHPRLSRWGARARKLSVDELPNLVNVLLGEMSLVGPRPEIPTIVRQYPPHYHRRHDVLPGITGMAQAAGRSDLTYDETLTYDLRYVDHHSVLTDLHIIWRTAVIVLSRSGAR